MRFCTATKGEVQCVLEAHPYPGKHEGVDDHGGVVAWTDNDVIAALPSLGKCTCDGEGDCEYCDPVGNYCDAVIEMRIKNDAEKATKIRKKGLRWGVTAVYIGTVMRSDGRVLTFTMSWDESEQHYIVVAVETRSKVDTVDDIFEDHAHQNLGPVGTELEAKKQSADYAADWLEKSAEPAEPCDCAPIKPLIDPEEIPF